MPLWPAGYKKSQLRLPFWITLFDVSCVHIHGSCIHRESISWYSLYRVRTDEPPTCLFRNPCPDQPLAVMHIFTCAAAVSYLFPAMNWKFVSILILDPLLAIDPCLTTTVSMHLPTEVKANCFYMKTLPTGRVNCVISEVGKATGRIFYSPQHMHSSGKASWSLFLDK